MNRTEVFAFQTGVTVGNHSSSGCTSRKKHLVKCARLFTFGWRSQGSNDFKRSGIDLWDRLRLTESGICRCVVLAVSAHQYYRGLHVSQVQHLHVKPAVILFVWDCGVCDLGASVYLGTWYCTCVPMSSASVWSDQGTVPPCYDWT